jgi:hypothetical protein
VSDIRASGTLCDSGPPGSFVTAGGLGIQKKLNVGGDATVAGSLQATTNVAVTGTADITGDTKITGALTVDKTAQATTSTTGAIVAAGGLGIAKNIHVGGSADITGDTKITGAVVVDAGDGAAWLGVKGAGDTQSYASIKLDSDDTTNNFWVMTFRKYSTQANQFWIYSMQDGSTGRNPFKLHMDAPSDALVLTSAQIQSSVANSISYTSDRRLKTNIRAVDTRECLEKVKQLRVREYEWHQSRVIAAHQEGTQRGFIAQEVEEAVPAAVSTSEGKETIKGKGGEEMEVEQVKRLSNGPLLVEMVGAVQELEAQITELKQTNEELKQTNDELKQRDREQQRTIDQLMERMAALEKLVLA